MTSMVSPYNIVNLKDNFTIKECLDNENFIGIYLTEIKNLITGNGSYHHKRLQVKQLLEYANKTWDTNDMVNILLSWTESERKTLFDILDKCVEIEDKVKTKLYELDYSEKYDIVGLKGDIAIEKILSNDKYQYIYETDLRCKNREIFTKPRGNTNECYDPYRTNNPDVPQLPDGLKVSDYICQICIDNLRTNGQLAKHNPYFEDNYPKVRVNYTICCYCENRYPGDEDLYYDRGISYHYDCNEIMSFREKDCLSSFKYDKPRDAIIMGCGYIEGYGHFDQMQIFPIKGPKIERKISDQIVKNSSYEAVGYYNYKDGTPIPYSGSLSEAIEKNYGKSIDNFYFTSFSELGDYLDVPNLNEKSLFCLLCIELLLKNKLFLAKYDSEWN